MLKLYKKDDLGEFWPSKDLYSVLKDEDLTYSPPEVKGWMQVMKTLHLGLVVRLRSMFFFFRVIFFFVSLVLDFEGCPLTFFECPAYASSIRNFPEDMEFDVTGEGKGEEQCFIREYSC